MCILCWNKPLYLYICYIISLSGKLMEFNKNYGSFTVTYAIQDSIKTLQVASETKYEDGETMTSL
jgi:hypothetical protein